LLFMVPLSLVPSSALLFFYVSTFRSMCAVPNMAVFCSFLTSWFRRISLTYCLNYFETVPIAPIITGIFIIIIIIIIFIIIIITFVQCIYNCIPETNPVSTVYSVATALYLQFTVPHVMLFSHFEHVLYFYISTIGK